MKVCMAQIRIDDGIDYKENNVNRVLKYIYQAAKKGCDLVVFPECVMGGFKDTDKIAEPIDGRFVTALKNMSAEYDIAIAGTFAERDGENVYDTAFIIHDGHVYTYRKNILFEPGGEDKIFARGGEAPKCYRIKDWTMGMIICYELRFPELVLGMLKAGLELLIVPAAWMAPRRVSDWEALIPARAVENQSYVVAVNRVGGKFFGRSAVAGPSGEVYRAGRNEGIYVVSIDKERIKETRSKIPAVETRRHIFSLKTPREV